MRRSTLTTLHLSSNQSSGYATTSGILKVHFHTWISLFGTVSLPTPKAILVLRLGLI